MLALHIQMSIRLWIQKFECVYILANFKIYLRFYFWVFWLIEAAELHVFVLLVSMSWWKRAFVRVVWVYVLNFVCFVCWFFTWNSLFIVYSLFLFIFNKNIKCQQWIQFLIHCATHRHRYEYDFFCLLNLFNFFELKKFVEKTVK